MKFFFLSIFLFVQASARPADLTPILTDYYQLKDALVAGDAAAAATAAGEMLQAINGVDMGSMTSADHMAFMALQDKLAFDARAYLGIQGHQPSAGAFYVVIRQPL